MPPVAAKKRGRRPKCQSVAVALGLQEVDEGRALLGEELEADGLLHFLVLEADQRVIDVAVSVELAEDIKSFVAAVLVD